MGLRFTKREFCLIHNAVACYMDHLEDLSKSQKGCSESTIKATLEEYEEIMDKLAARVHNLSKK